MELVYKISYHRMQDHYYNFERRYSIHPACNSRKKESAELAAEVVKEIPSLHGKLNCVIDRISVEQLERTGNQLLNLKCHF